MKTLLLIEDDEINRQFLLEILQEDYVVLTAANGQHGLDILEKEAQSISAILLDIQMPVMNGFQFLKHVENNSDYNRIPILVTTVLDGEEDEKECLKLGVSDFIVKPYSPLLVKMRVENIIHMTESEFGAGNGCVDRVKYRIICKDGTVKTVLDYGRFVHTEMYGDVYYVFINDVTEDF